MDADGKRRMQLASMDSDERGTVTASDAKYGELYSRSIFASDAGAALSSDQAKMKRTQMKMHVRCGYCYGNSSSNCRVLEYL
jgi:hypothetical protein